MAHDVFISYSTSDQKIVEALSHYLEEWGIRCFVAYRDIPKGFGWASAITDAIENCQVMVVVFSKDFNSSPQVDREIEICSDEKKPIITFRIQDTKFTGAKKYFLKNLNWIDAFPNPDRYFDDVLRSVKSLLVTPNIFTLDPITSSCENYVKPSITIGTIGTENSGRTTLIAAIVTVLEKSVVYKPQRDNTKNIGIQYQTNKRSYSHIMYATHEDFTKNMVTLFDKLAGAIIVIDVTETITSEVRSQILMAHEFNLHKFVVFLNKIDTLEDTGLIDCVEMEIRELLKHYGCDGDNTPVICGSALGALNGMPKWEKKIIELINVLDTYIPNPILDKDKPFLMPIEDVSIIKDRGIVLTGEIETGIVRVGDTPEIVGFSNKTKTVTCLGVEMFRKLIDSGEAGDQVGLLVKGITIDDVKRGMVIAKKGYVKPYKYFEAEIYMFTKDEGGITKPFQNNFCLQFYIRTLDVSGRITLSRGVNCVKPGDNALITVELAYPVAINTGLRFAIRDYNKTIGAGRIIGLL